MGKRKPNYFGVLGGTSLYSLHSVLYVYSVRVIVSPLEILNFQFALYLTINTSHAAYSCNYSDSWPVVEKQGKVMNIDFMKQLKQFFIS